MMQHLGVFPRERGETIITRYNPQTRRFETTKDAIVITPKAKEPVVDRAAQLLCTLCGGEINLKQAGHGMIAQEPCCATCIHKLVSPDAHLGAVES